MTDFIVVIPARFASTRFPGKPLALIDGIPMIVHVIRRAQESGARRVIVATDDPRIEAVVTPHAEVCMTSTQHQSGTERIAEVIERMHIEANNIIVNVQGDEPFIAASSICLVATNLAESHCEMATLATPIVEHADRTNPNVVKVVRNVRGEALYFSRSVIPFERETMPNESDYLRHLGIYAYRAAYVQRYLGYARTTLEHVESLEQLRALWYGDRIHVDVLDENPAPGIDTPEDLERLNRWLQR